MYKRYLALNLFIFKGSNFTIAIMHHHLADIEMHDTDE